MNYSDYTVRVSVDPTYYGSSCTEAHVAIIVKNLGDSIASEFPGINIERWTDGKSSSTTGPDRFVIDEINQWIENNWTKSL